MHLTYMRLLAQCVPGHLEATALDGLWCGWHWPSPTALLSVEATGEHGIAQPKPRGLGWQLFGEQPDWAAKRTQADGFHSSEVRHDRGNASGRPREAASWTSIQTCRSRSYRDRSPAADHHRHRRHAGCYELCAHQGSPRHCRPERRERRRGSRWLSLIAAYVRLDPRKGPDIWLTISAPIWVHCEGALGSPAP